MDRRSFHALAAAAAFAGTGLALALPGARAADAGAPAPRPADGPEAALAARCRALEGEVGGRIGVALIDGRSGTGTPLHAAWRGDERFPMCSTFKWLASAALLARVDGGHEHLARRLRFERRALVAHSPVTERHTGAPGMTLGELCEATITESDNTAANLILQALGGPAAVTRYARGLGDAVTRLDRTEPQLNESRPGDERDTTTPRAMAGLLQALLLGDALRPAARQQLVDWMLATRTSGERLRKDLPAGWRLADKTGSGAHGSHNDVGVFWRPDGRPVVLAVYCTGSSAGVAERNAVIAALARHVTSQA
jgi:beta-lactamase class A